MISDRRAAELCAALYGLPTRSPVAFAHVDDGSDDGVYWALAQEDDVDVIVFRGSVTPEDWLRDIFATPYADRDLGPVHHGFYLGVRNVWTDLQASKALRGGPIFLTGHSLGAARAAIMAGVMVSAMRAPIGRTVFGEPKPGFKQLADLTRFIETKSFRNGFGANHDAVTDLPLTIHGLGLHYERQVDVTVVDAEPDTNDPSGIFCLHHMALYLRALQ